MAKSLDLEIQQYLPSLVNEAAMFNIEQYNRDIDQSLAEIKAGNYITQDDLEKEMKQW